MYNNIIKEQLYQINIFLTFHITFFTKFTVILFIDNLYLQPSIYRFTSSSLTTDHFHAHRCNPSFISAIQPTHFHYYFAILYTFFSCINHNCCFSLFALFLLRYRSIPSSNYNYFQLYPTERLMGYWHKILCFYC